MFAVRGDDEVDVPVGMACVRGVTNVLTKWINLESLTETWRWRPMYVNHSLNDVTWPANWSGYFGRIN